MKPIWDQHCKDCKYWDGDIMDYGWQKGFYYCLVSRSWEDPEDAPYCENYEYEKKSGGCFLTTACCEFFGLPDDCDELTTLRAFRDGYMRCELDNGFEDIAWYYVVSPQICDAIDGQDDDVRRAEYIGIFETIHECIEHINAGRNEDAYHLYKDMVLRLTVKYL